MLYYKNIDIKGIAKLYSKYIYKYSYLLKSIASNKGPLSLYFKRSSI